jgi:hypothetical protein
MYLSIPVIFLSLMMLALSRRMEKRYKETIVSGLKERDVAIGGTDKATGLEKIHFITASFSRFDVQTIMMGEERPDGLVAETVSGPRAERVTGGGEAQSSTGASHPLDWTSALKSQDDGVVLRALEGTDRWSDDQIPALIRLLARDNLQKKSSARLRQIGSAALPKLALILQDEDADFVIRRRIPDVLGGIGGVDAERALFEALSAGRFEVRYRTAVTLARLRKKNFRMPRRVWEPLVWSAIRREVQYNRPVWEMRRLLDSLGPGQADGLVEKRVGARCELSLEHTFRMLTLVLDPEPVAAALHGIILDEEDLKSFALEYLESALPADICERLWLLIGDASEHRRAKQTRPLQQVVSDLMQSRATLFQGEMDRKALKSILK